MLLHLAASLFHLIKWWLPQHSVGETVYTVVEMQSIICNVYGLTKLLERCSAEIKGEKFLTEPLKKA
jgi:hypothetical protein